MRVRRSAGGALVGALLLTVGTPVSSATAADYRYWQYWRVAPAMSSWTFAATGPATRPADGAVEGWRFGISGSAGDDRPRWAATGLFDQVCGTTPRTDQTKRVAVVIDFGTASDAPTGEAPPSPVTGCATLTGAENGYDALRQVAAARISGGLVCGIAGYPARECGAVVTAPAPSTPAPTPLPTSAAPTPTAAPPGVQPGASAGGATPTAPAGAAATNGVDGSPESPTGQAGSGGAGSGDESPSAGSSSGAVDPAANRSSSPVADRSATGSASGTLLGLLLIAGLATTAFWLRRGRA
jgi:hypothetical protein